MEQGNFQGIIIATVAILVGLAFWSTIGSSVGTLAVLQTNTNTSFTYPTTNTTWFDLLACGQQNTSGVVVFNKSNNILVPAANYSLRQGTSTTDGFLITQIRNVSLDSSTLALTGNVTCTYQPRGYIAEGGTRALVNLIPIFFALLIAISALPDVRTWIKDQVFG